MIFEISNAKLKQHFNPRRFGIHANKIHLFGSPKSGKTSLALYYAKSFKNPLYIDFDDLRNTNEFIKQILLKITFEKKIDLLILDNIPSDFSPANLPNIANIITINQRDLPKSHLPNIPRMEILPLNFEEFIGFDKLNLDLKELFETFIKVGNLPFMLKDSKDLLRLEKKQQMLKSAINNDMDIFLALMRFQRECVSIFQLYNILKKQKKISKDRLYSVIDDFSQRRILLQVSHLNKPKAPKKAFFFDFSAAFALSYERNFMAVFENMIFLEILGKKRRDSAIFYSEKIPLICENLCYFPMPFKSKEMIVESLKNIDFMGLNAIVITLDLNDEIVIKNRKIPLISFINFALD